MHFEDPDADMPLEADEIKALIPGHITSRAQLNNWQQENILAAKLWGFKGLTKIVITPAFIVKLHEKMFYKTWTWAGKLRQQDNQRGEPWADIAQALTKLSEDSNCWLEEKAYELEELLARLHYRLVAIQAFFDGNGRHGRLLTDLLYYKLARKQFDWGKTLNEKPLVIRQRYHEALQAAEQGNLSPLLELMCS